MTPSNESGSLAPQFLGALFLIAAIGAGTGLIISTIVKSELRAKRSVARQTAAVSLIASIVDTIRADETPLTNSRDDDVWSRSGKTENGFAISIRPLSDAINPNFVRKNVFEKTGIGELFLPGKTADEFQQFREDRGITLRADAYSSFFVQKPYADCFSPYGWANVNILDEFAARDLVTSITGSKDRGDAIMRRIQDLLLSKIIVTPQNVADVLGSDFQDVFPFINAEPPMNVNFVDSRVLRELVAYPDYHVKAPASRCDELIAMREESGGVSSSDIATVLGIEPSNRLSCYFGSITWFYEIRLSDDRGSFTAIVCRIPQVQSDTGSKPTFRQIELRGN